MACACSSGARDPWLPLREARSRGVSRAFVGSCASKYSSWLTTASAVKSSTCKGAKRARVSPGGRQHGDTRARRRVWLRCATRLRAKENDALAHEQRHRVCGSRRVHEAWRDGRRFRPDAEARGGGRRAPRQQQLLLRLGSQPRARRKRRHTPRRRPAVRLWGGRRDQAPLTGKRAAQCSMSTGKRRSARTRPSRAGETPRDNVEDAMARVDVSSSLPKTHQNFLRARIPQALSVRLLRAHMAAVRGFTVASTSVCLAARDCGGAACRPASHHCEVRSQPSLACRSPLSPRLTLASRRFCT